MSPYLSAYTALAFAWLREDGRAIPEAVETKLHDYLDAFLKRDVAPDFYTRGMASTEPLPVSMVTFSPSAWK